MQITQATCSKYLKQHYTNYTSKYIGQHTHSVQKCHRSLTLLSHLSLIAPITMPAKPVDSASPKSLHLPPLTAILLQLFPRESAHKRNSFVLPSRPTAQKMPSYFRRPSAPPGIAKYNRRTKHAAHPAPAGVNICKHRFGMRKQPADCASAASRKNPKRRGRAGSPPHLAGGAR